LFNLLFESSLESSVESSVDSSVESSFKLSVELLVDLSLEKLFFEFSLIKNLLTLIGLFHLSSNKLRLEVSVLFGLLV
jgi:hypothetical protein